MGAERIRGELLKLNIKVAKRTIQKYMQIARSKLPSGQSWSTFLQTHGKDIWACDFVPVVTLFFKTLHAFVIVHHESRRVVHVAVTDHPTDEWTSASQSTLWITQQVREATPFEEKPKFLICDNDKRYGHLFEQVVQAPASKPSTRPTRHPGRMLSVNGLSEVYGGNAWITCWCSANAS
jgi:hypothetical protein